MERDQQLGISLFNLSEAAWLTDVTQSAIVVTVATYLAVFVQMAFPFTLFNRHTRHLVFVLLVGMHAGIGLLMGLPVFSAFMIATDLLLFTDSEWRRGAARSRRMLARIRGMRAHPRSAPPGPARELARGLPTTTRSVPS